MGVGGVSALAYTHHPPSNNVHASAPSQIPASGKTQGQGGGGTQFFEAGDECSGSESMQSSVGHDHDTFSPPYDPPHPTPRDTTQRMGRPATHTQRSQSIMGYTHPNGYTSQQHHITGITYITGGAVSSSSSSSSSSALAFINRQQLSLVEAVAMQHTLREQGLEPGQGLGPGLGLGLPQSVNAGEPLQIVDASSSQRLHIPQNQNDNNNNATRTTTTTTTTTAYGRVLEAIRAERVNDLPS